MSTYAKILEEIYWLTIGFFTSRVTQDYDTSRFSSYLAPSSVPLTLIFVTHVGKYCSFIWGIWMLPYT